MIHRTLFYGIMAVYLFGFCGTGYTAMRPTDLRTADQIMKYVDARYDGKSSIIQSTLILIDRQKRERVRTMKRMTRKYVDSRKSIAFVLSPSEVSGTAYLSYQWKDSDKDDDSWLYLPALKKVKRIAAADKSGSFLGSDFTFADLNDTEIVWYDYTILNGDDIVDGYPAWHIQAVPKPEFYEKVLQETGYKKSEIWVRKDNFMQVKAKIWVQKGSRIKYFTASDIELIDKVWTAKRLQMVTTKDDKIEHASVFQLDEVAHDRTVEDGIFTPQHLQRGL